MHAENMPITKIMGVPCASPNPDPMETHMNPNPKRAALGLLAILAAGCPPCGLIPCIDELPPREDVEEVEEPAPCLSLVNEVFPEPGDAAVYYRSSVVVSFGQPEPDATIELRTAAGAAVEGAITWTEDQRSVTLTPSTPLAPSTTYEVEVHHSCDRSRSVSWTTSAAGAPVDPAAVEGGVYAVDLSQGRWIEPVPGFLEMIDLVAPIDQRTLISMVAAQEADMTLRFALEKEEALDVCQTTLDHTFSADITANPYFELETSGWESAFRGSPFHIDTLRMTGAFTPDGSAIEGVTLDGLADTRIWDALIGIPVCDAEDLGALRCVPCSDGEPLCMVFTIDQLSMVRVGTERIGEILEVDVDMNPLCSTQ